MTGTGLVFVAKTYQLGLGAWKSYGYTRDLDLIQDPELVKQLMEINIMTCLREYITTYRMPHFPLIYDFGICSRDRMDRSVLHVYMEVLSGDIRSMAGKLSSDDVKSIVLQYLVAMYLFHSLKLVHRDTHTANVMFHRVAPSAKIRYLLPRGLDITIPSQGFFCYLIDFGLAERATDHVQVRTDVMQFINDLLTSVAPRSNVSVQVGKSLYSLRDFLDKATADTVDHLDLIRALHSQWFESTSKETSYFDLRSICFDAFPSSTFMDGFGPDDVQQVMDYVRRPPPPPIEDFYDTPPTPTDTTAFSFSDLEKAPPKKRPRKAAP